MRAVRHVVGWWIHFVLIDLSCLLFGHMTGKWGPRCRRCRRKGRPR